MAFDFGVLATGSEPVAVRVAQAAACTMGSSGAVRVHGRSVSIERSMPRSQLRAMPSNRS